MGWPEPPLNGLLIGTLVFIGVAFLGAAIVAIAFRKGQTCYAVNFTVILIVMAFIMWACTYMAQMYPLVYPEYSED
ncbi:V-type proton ATPase subunit e1 [Histomonas meleagridis]|uniref:V-type proton ATPase subunit e1 n=1 Tax=Histomonas meleagridis TaxID=135588 RepID=UPI00355A81D5|nr:V-type proton ATPase subunit e1 [Histomonas meleagridis]KAH0802660.1 V-type proton ATPase subunit e1 [Histomonas meleagridis]